MSSPGPNSATPVLPHISIVVLTYNRQRLLEDCLRSLTEQDYPADQLEILVSDDGSSDGTRQVVERFNSGERTVRYLHQPHQGIAAARNQGIRHARGSIIAIVADDYILPRAYAATIENFFRDQPDAQIIRFKVVAAHSNPGSRISHLYYDVSVRRRLLPQSRSSVPETGNRWTRLLRKLPATEEVVTTEHSLEAAGAAAFRRSVFTRVGLFDESLQRGEDTDLTLRLNDLGIPIHYFPHLPIPHQYKPLMGDTLKKCFASGVSRYSLQRKRQQSLGIAGPGAAVVTRRELSSVLLALWRARQAGSPLKTLLYLPFMLLFEVTNKVGFACGWLNHWRLVRQSNSGS